MFCVHAVWPLNKPICREPFLWYRSEGNHYIISPFPIKRLWHAILLDSQRCWFQVLSYKHQGYFQTILERISITFCVLQEENVYGFRSVRKSKISLVAADLQ